MVYSDGLWSTAKFPVKSGHGVRLSPTESDGVRRSPVKSGRTRLESDKNLYSPTIDIRFRYNSLKSGRTSGRTPTSFCDLFKKHVKSPVKLCQVRWIGLESDRSPTDSVGPRRTPSDYLILPDLMIQLSDSLILTKSDRSPIGVRRSPTGVRRSPTGLI